jgi:recombination protein RecT
MVKADALVKKNEQANINTMLAKMENEFKRALPRHIPVERFMRVGITEIRRNPKLGECTPISLIGALMMAAQDGLEPGIDGQCHLIPRWSKKTGTMEVNYQRGYQGILELARRTGQYSSILVRTVHENDKFDFEEGSGSFIKFKRALTNRGEPIAYFAFTRLSSGEESFTVISKEDAEKHRDRFAASKDKSGNIFGPWNDDFDSMAKKTVLLMHFKYQPKSVEIRDLVNTDDRVITYDPEIGIIPQHDEKTALPDKPEIKKPGKKSGVQQELSEILADESFSNAVDSAVSDGKIMIQDSYTEAEAAEAISFIKQYQELYKELEDAKK